MKLKNIRLDYLQFGTPADRMLAALSSFCERRSIEKSRSSMTSVSDLRNELRALIRRAKDLPVSDVMVLRKVELDVPPELVNELAELRDVLHSKNMKVC